MIDWLIDFAARGSSPLAPPRSLRHWTDQDPVPEDWKFVYLLRSVHIMAITSKEYHCFILWLWTFACVHNRVYVLLYWWWAVLNSDALSKSIMF